MNIFWKLFPGLLFLEISSAEILKLEYQVNDGVDADSYIGNIPQDSQQVKPSRQGQHFSVVKGKEYLKIDSNGDLRTARKIDREKICSKRIETCILTSEVIITPREYFKLFKGKVEIIIQDLNDNSPIFPESELTIHIAENAQIGTEIRLDSATDADTAAYGIERYYLGEEDRLVENPYFDLQEEHINDVIIPILKVKKRIDFERVKSQELKLNAIDRGGRIGSATIHVIIDDENDNDPVFTKDKYRIQITESTPIGEIILRLRAEDADSGENGRLTYSYNSLVPESTRNMFPINSTSGAIRVGRKIDFEHDREHILYVQAADDGVNPRKAYCTVIVEIIDTNDNPPSIDVYWESEEENLKISEDIQIGAFVAFVSVSDSDLGPAGEISSFDLVNEDFGLEVIDEPSNRYIIKTLRPLDRERIGQYNLELRARDAGIPPLSSVKIVKIEIEDVNDNSPYFGHATYFLSIDENNDIGKSLTRIIANDLDSGKNGQIKYSLKSPNEYVAIDENTGELSLIKQIDAEKLPSDDKLIKVQILATDLGVPPQVGETELEIQIRDLNDNHPAFEETKYEFEIDEHEPIGSLVGQPIRATDLDSDSVISYKLLNNQKKFEIDSKTGEIRLLRELDYEKDSKSYKLNISASDGELESFSEVMVTIRDINDNPPKLDEPDNHVIQIPMSTSRETLQNGIIGSIRASDPDHGKNGQVSFKLDGKSSLFDISSDGNIILKRNFLPHDDPFQLIPLLLSDGGNPQQITQANIFVYQSDDNTNSTAIGEMIARKVEEHRKATAEFSISLISNGFIFACLIGIFIVSCLIVILCCIRCRRLKSSSNQSAGRSTIEYNKGSKRDQRDDADWMHEVQWQNFSKNNCQQNNCQQNGYESPDIDSGAGDSISDNSGTLPRSDKRRLYNSPITSMAYSSSPIRASQNNNNHGVHHITTSSPGSHLTPVVSSHVTISSHVTPSHANLKRSQPSFSTFKDEDSLSVEIYDECHFGTPFKNQTFTTNTIMNN